MRRAGAVSGRKTTRLHGKDAIIEDVLDWRLPDYVPAG